MRRSTEGMGHMDTSNRSNSMELTNPPEEALIEDSKEEDSSTNIAKVTFRVRCETLGHGEVVFLVRDCDSPYSRPIPLYTTASAHPWYISRAPLALPIPKSTSDCASDTPSLPSSLRMSSLSSSSTSSQEGEHFRYRYAVYRGGVFHRWEKPTDGPIDMETLHHHGSTRSIDVSSMDLQEDEEDGHHQSAGARHQLPLRLLCPGELYTVNDILGVTIGTPDIDHIRVHPQHAPLSNLAGLHHQSSTHSLHHQSSNHSFGTSPSTSATFLAGKGGKETVKKKVGFAPQPVPYRGSIANKTPSSAQNPQPTPSKKQAVHLNSTDGLVVASAFLPIILHRSDDGVWSADWDYEVLLSMQTHLRVTRVGVVKWRGWHGNVGKDGSPSAGVPVEEREKVEACLAPFNCVPVWVTPSLFGEMYNGFCKGVLWPVLHNVTSVYSSNPNNSDLHHKNDSSQLPIQHTEPVPPPSSQTQTIDSDFFSYQIASQFAEYSMDDVAQGPIHGDGGKEAALWSAYTAVNRQFADVIVQCFNEGDLVWIHGFHLLILPSFLTRRIPMAKIGLFLHTPFPSSEIFRTLWCREDLLRGMLNSDQVGFHLFEYARHFLTCCRRLLGLNYGMIPDASGGHNLAIDTNGRQVTVTSIHAGIEPKVLEHVLIHSSTFDRVRSIRNQFHGKTIFCAIDRMESLKGIPLKMLGIERFLHRCPEFVGKIVLIQVGISAFERGDDYTKTKAEVLQTVANINTKWPGTVQFKECQEKEMRLQQRLALLSAADVVMVTPIRDGLNLIPLEFTFAHQDVLTNPPDGRKRGLCILSEFSSCTRVMRGALHVNPWKISEIANAFHQSLIMSNEERIRRIKCASEFVTRVTTRRWALAVMLDLKGVHKNIEAGTYAGAGLGLGFRLLGMETGFVPLEINVVAKAFKNSRSRLILLDYGGTILSNDNLDSLQRFQVVNKTRAPSFPTKALLNTLKDLCADKRNIVFVVSGKERHSLSKMLPNIPSLGLAAEHGMFVSWPTNNTSTRRRWETLVSDIDKSWRSIAITIMEVYTSRTHGSYIEETEMKVLWQYRDADPEFGYLQSRELEDHLSNVLRSFPVDILHGGVEEGGYVEVRPKGVNKGVLSTHVLKNMHKFSTHTKIDFGLVLGDDHCDEPMLSVMRQVGRRAAECRIARTGEEDNLPPIPATITLVDVSPCDEHVSQDLQMFTCTVGKKPSAAENYLNDVDEVHELLESLVKVATRDHKFHSAVDLRNLSGPSLVPGSGGLGGFMTGGGFMSPTGMPVVPNSFLSPSMPNNDLSGSGHGMKKSSSMGEFKISGEQKEKRMSNSLNEFLGTIEQEDEDEDIFF
mmetsp:Transcript_33867/g.49693  ORF Transcript_33867/g.49693 Transcript_33867/m.49693 type:complete len:1336 (+) Transcript_33867:345-4352(+)